MTLDSMTTAYLTQEALGGLSAGVIGTIIGYPLDVMKTRLQTSVNGTTTTTTSTSATRPATTVVRSSSSGLSIVADIIRSEGLVGLYRGVGPPLVSLTLLNTMSFTSYGYFRTAYGGRDGWDVQNGLAGMTGAPAFALISTVENRLKTQLQLHHQKKNHYYTNSWQCAKYLIQYDGGWSSLYNGHVVNTIREAVFVASYFFVYEGIRELLLRPHRHHQPESERMEDDAADNCTSTTIRTMLTLPATLVLLVWPSQQLAIPIAGGIAGMTSWAVSFPLDCVRAGVQGQPTRTNLTANTTTRQPQHLGAVAVLRDLVRQRGIAGLYRGVGPSIARAFLVSGSRFSAYEGAIWLLRSSPSGSD